MLIARRGLLVAGASAAMARPARAQTLAQGAFTHRDKPKIGHEMPDSSRRSIRGERVCEPLRIPLHRSRPSRYRSRCFTSNFALFVKG
jgi:hypothetical protein